MFKVVAEVVTGRKRGGRERGRGSVREEEEEENNGSCEEDKEDRTGDSDDNDDDDRGTEDKGIIGEGDDKREECDSPREEMDFGDERDSKYFSIFSIKSCTCM